MEVLSSLLWDRRNDSNRFDPVQRWAAINDESHADV